MHEHRGVGPQRVIEPMSQDGQGLEELPLEARVGPPGEEPDVHEPAGPLRIPAEEPEHLRGRAEQVAELRPLEQDRPVIVVVEDPPDTQRRQREQDRQHRRGRGEATHHQQRSHGGRELP